MSEDPSADDAPEAEDGPEAEEALGTEDLPGAGEPLEPSIRDRPLAELVGAIAGPSVSPGSGTAASLVLVLAAACAHKALAVTRKHRPLEEAEESAAMELAMIIERAFDSADSDASCFAAFLRHRDAQTARALRDSDRQGQEVTSRFESLLRTMESAIDPAVSGDVTTAWDLLAVVQRIQATIAEDNAGLTVDFQ